MNQLDIYFLKESTTEIPDDDPTKTHFSQLYREINLQPNAVFDLLDHLQIYLSDRRSESNRRKALQILSLVFSNCELKFPTNPSKSNEASESGKNQRALLEMLFRKLETDSVLAKETLELVQLLKNKFSQPNEFSRWFLDFLRTGKFNTQDYKRQVRGSVLEMLAECVSFELALTETLDAPALDSLFDVLGSHCFDEKDARNLLTVFDMFQTLIFASSEEVLRRQKQRVCQNLMKYFPITFSNSAQSKIKVSGLALKSQFAAIFANNVFYSQFLEEALEKLKENEDVEAVWDNLGIFFGQFNLRFGQNK